MWTKLDDSFCTNPKIVKLSDRAFRLHVSALIWCGRNMTDGVIDLGAARTLIAPATKVVTRRLAGELGGALLWHPIDAEGEWWSIHDYLQYQFSRAEWEARSRRGSNAAATRWQRRGNAVGGKE